VRLLTPADFGIVSMAVILFPYLRYLGEFGIPRTIINLRELTENQIAQLNTVGAFFGVAGFVVAALVARPFAQFFRVPALAAVVTVTCLALVPEGLRAVSEGLLSKEMRFGLLSWFEAARAIVAALVTLALAYFHFGYWSLVFGNLVGTIVRAGLIVAWRPYRFAIPRWRSIRGALSFGRHLAVSVVAQNSYMRLDNLTAGRVLGQTALGYYGMAWTLANVPVEKVTTLATVVVPSYLAVAQNDHRALRRYFRTLSEAIALLTFPATIGISLVAPELVPLVLGRKWDNMILPLQILCLYTGFRSVVALVPKVLTAVGNARYVMWNDLAALLILPIAFYVGSHWGTGGIAWGWVAAYPVVVLPLYWKTFQAIEMRLGEYLRALRPAIDGVLVMSVAVLSVKRAAHSLQLLPILVLEIAAGALVYSAVLILFHRPRVMAFTGFLKGLALRRA
ncbi:MAG: lipopolysaccharide biosynthesis protein, partial [Acidobacteria bacterium]|nr:lipopolysaccharide biosynthesis protein [Acidobacteriota bacterium]